MDKKYATSFMVVNTMEKNKAAKKVSLCVRVRVCVHTCVCGVGVGSWNFKYNGEKLPRILYFHLCKYGILYLLNTLKVIFQAALSL